MFIVCASQNKAKLYQQQAMACSGQTKAYKSTEWHIEYNVA